MRKKGQKLISIVVLISFGVLFLFGEGYAAAPTVKLVVDPDKTDIYVGAVPIAIVTQASGTKLAYKWELLGPGKLEGEGPAAFYHVPEVIEKDPARAIITVTVTDGTGQETTATVMFNILASPPQRQPSTTEPTTKPESPTPPQEQPSPIKPESKGMSKRTKIILGGVATAAAIGGGVALFAGGGDDDGESDYNFNGTWLFTETITEDPYGIVGVGETMINSFVINQDGSNFVMTFPSEGWVYRGNCDPKAKTFTASIILEGPVTHTYSGTGTDENTMTISSMIQAGSAYIRFDGTAILQSRGSSKIQGGTSRMKEIVEQLQNLR
jgi:hypothetical protein